MLVTGALYLHGLDDAIAGASDCGKLIYDYKKIVSIYEKEGMTQEEAIEYFEFNIRGSYVGEHSPVFLDRKVDL